MELTSIIIAFSIDQIADANSELASLFASGGEEYLSKFEYEGEVFLGKSVEPPLSFEQLDAVRRNVLSLGQRIDPHRKWDDNSLFVFSYPGGVVFADKGGVRR